MQGSAPLLRLLLLLCGEQPAYFFLNRRDELITGLARGGEQFFLIVGELDGRFHGLLPFAAAFAGFPCRLQRFASRAALLSLKPLTNTAARS